MKKQKQLCLGAKQIARHKSNAVEVVITGFSQALCLCLSVKVAVAASCNSASGGPRGIGFAPTDARARAAPAEVPCRHFAKTSHSDGL
jgi:hypothetical protein